MINFRNLNKQIAWSTISFFAVGAILLVGACKQEGGSLKLTPVQDKPYEVEKSGQADPIADARAKKGGTFTVWGSAFPKSLNRFLDNNSTTGEIMALQFESLATLHSTKNTWVGELAESWKVSPDRRVFTFKIHPKAAWSDGKPVTAHDIQFFYDVIMNKKHLTPAFRVALKRFDRPEVVDEKTVRMTAKVDHWRNFGTAATMTALPKHIWKGKDFNTINFKFPVMSGPYKLASVKKGRLVILKRRSDWWGRVRKYNQNKFNFDYIRYRFIADRNKTLEAFKKQTFDAYSIYTSSIWARKTQFKQVKNNWVIRQRIYNKEPRGFQGFAINLRRPLFKDIRVRRALAHLLQREQMNKKFMYDEYFILNSYYPDLYPGNRNPNVPVIKYDPSKARKLLAEAGWKVGPDGVLAKGGKRFAFKFITFMVDKRHLTLYVNDLKKVGIQASIEQLSLSTIRRRLDNHEFDMYWIAWGAGRLRDPEGVWHSKTAQPRATQNIPGFEDKLVDDLIEKQKTMNSLDARNGVLRRIDARLNELIPYVLLWQSDHTRLLYWNRFGTPKYVLDKFNRENAAIVYWWLDPAKEKALKEAMQANKPLPPGKEKVYYRD